MEGQRPADKHDQGLIQEHCLCCSQSERITIMSVAGSFTCMFILRVCILYMYILNIEIRHTYLQYVNTYVHLYVCMSV